MSNGSHSAAPVASNKLARDGRVGNEPCYVTGKKPDR